LGALALTGLSVAFILLVARFTPVSLAWFDGPLSAVISSQAETDIELENTEISWSEHQIGYVLGIGRLQINDKDQFKAELGSVYIEASTAALWREGRMILSALSIGSVDMVAAKTDYLAAPNVLTRPSNVVANQSVDWLAYVRRIDIRNINIQSAGDTTTELADEGGSYVMLFREDGALNGALDLAYIQDEKPSRLDGRMNLRLGKGGYFELNMDNVNPQAIGNFSRFLAPLRAVSLPVSGRLSGDLGAAGIPQTGVAEIRVLPGAVQLSDTRLPFEAMDFSVQANFAEKDFTIVDGLIDINGMRGALAGSLNYETTPSGQLRQVNVNLTGTNVRIDQAEIFKSPIEAPHISTNMSYNAVTQTLSIDDVTMDHQHGRVSSSGLISMAGEEINFDLTTRFSAMSLDGVMSLWPNKVGRKSRAWVTQNLLAGRLTGGSLILRAGLDELTNRPAGTPLRQEAITFELSLADADVRALKGLPAFEGVDAELLIRGNSFEMTTQGGAATWPREAALADMDEAAQTTAASPQKLRLGKGTMRIDKSNAPGVPADLTFETQGAVRPVLEALTKPPLRTIRDSKFDVTRVHGAFAGDLKLSIGLDPKKKRLPLRYQFDGMSENLAVDGTLGRFAVSNGRVRVQVNGEGLSMQGRAIANEVDLGFELRQPFRRPPSIGASEPLEAAQAKPAAPARLALTGTVSATDFERLGFAWVGRRMNGTARMNVMIDGPLDKPSGYQVRADLKDAEVMPIPLAYRKPAGEKALIEAFIKADAAGKLAHLDAMIELADEAPLKAEMDFTKGVLARLEMTPVSMGRTQELRVGLESDDDGRRYVVTATQFDANGLFDNGNLEIESPARDMWRVFDFLGPNATVDLQIDKVVGGDDESLDGLQLFAVRRDALFEKVNLQGVFPDGTELLGSLARTDAVSRSYSLQTENASRLFHLVNVLNGVSGGAMLLQGRIYDDYRDDNYEYMQSSGRFDMVSFRARKVPTLAQILSVGSLRGFADTLNGEGIQFDHAEFKFSIVDDLLRVKGGRMSGSALGLTTQGDYNMNSLEYSFGGTAVPAYALNSLVSKIPIIGRLLTGRRGEGLLGLGYRVTGRADDPRVFVNPLSVLTPGIFRRIFEVGIGLSSDGPLELPTSDVAD
jgi:hypothetical protein